MLIHPHLVCLIEYPISNFCDYLKWHTTKQVQQESCYNRAQLPLQVHKEITRDNGNLDKKCFFFFHFLNGFSLTCEIVDILKKNKINIQEYQYTFCPDIPLEFCQLF